MYRQGSIKNMSHLKKFKIDMFNCESTPKIFTTNAIISLLTFDIYKPKFNVTHKHSINSHIAQTLLFFSIKYDKFDLQLVVLKRFSFKNINVWDHLYTFNILNNNEWHIIYKYKRIKMKFTSLFFFSRSFWKGPLYYF
jgi:hypothetical protein